MDFIHEPYQPGETIAAVATPLGEGGVAIIRISGECALQVAEKVFSGPVKSYKTHTAHYGNVVDCDGNVVDQALILVMLAPRSYTGEDTVEIHCHGGGLITKRVLKVVIDAGARLARPGEFTFKAFINEKIDLAQAEAVQELISAKNEHALNAAESNLQGRLSQRVSFFQQELTELAAILEAWVDFPEEGLEFASKDDILATLSNLCSQLQALIVTYHNGKVIHEGISLCLIGSPNVGKSSLMNALLNKERAIVTHIAGTTRDILEEDLRLNGLNFRLIDTAGIRDHAGVIEREGIRRSKEAMQKADLVLFVLDASKGFSSQDKELMEMLPAKKTIAVWNKIDLVKNDIKPSSLKFPYEIFLSAKEKQGLDALHVAIDKVIWENGPPAKEELILTNMRHKEALESAVLNCQEVIEGLQKDLSPEFISIHMRHALRELGKILGMDIGESVLSAIFSKFCIGK